MKCNNIILSEEYGDFIGRYNGDISEALTEQVECTQVIDDSYFCAYYRLDMLPTINVANFTYNVIPKLIRFNGYNCRGGNRFHKVAESVGV